MDPTVFIARAAEFAPAYLQIAVTLGLIVLSTLLWRRYRKDYFGLWAVAWMIYALRGAAIITFLSTASLTWLYWYLVLTGWTAVALLWAGLVFSRWSGWRAEIVLLATFPPIWSYVAIYRLDSFMLAVWPAVAFMSLATGWTAWTFFRYDRKVGSPAARVLGGALLLWALHHLDYLFLQSRGLWNPWGYYLDILLLVGTGTGILLLVLEDLDRGLGTLTSLSGELQGRGRHGESVSEAVLRRALGLRGVHGSALYWTEDEAGLSPGAGTGSFLNGAGVAALWPYEGAPPSALEAVGRVAESGQPEVLTGLEARGGAGWAHPYTAALPILRDDRVAGALVVVGEARDPFTALDAGFLRAFGAQVGAALENEGLYDDLRGRTEELERMQIRMIQQHEEERNRVSRELHDETAQVLAALNMQLGLLREQGGEGVAAGLARAQGLVADGIKSIRSVTRNLRPSVLDDLGLLPALRALARDFGSATGLNIDFAVPADLPEVAPEAELALFRALQETLANAARHGQARHVTVRGVSDGDRVALTIEDDGVGLPVADTAVLDRTRGGLAGIRERIGGVGGAFTLENREEGGARVRVVVPTANNEEVDQT